MDFTPLELGSDIAGSIRLPAHACGVFGLKPSYGLVPLRGHIPGPPGAAAVADLNVAGPLARNTEDLELAFGLLAGPEDGRAKAWRLQLPPARAQTLSDYRILVWLDDDACRVDRGVLEVLSTAVKRLAEAGATLEHGPGPIPLADAIRVHRALLMGVSCSGPTDEEFAEMVAAVQAGAGAGDDVGARHLRWLTQSKRDWNAANEERAQMRWRWQEFFERYDALLCPVCAVAAIPHDHTPGLEARHVVINGEQREYWDQVCWISMASACYLPAASVPVGLTQAGLPVGLQVVAPYLEDLTAIDLARRIGDVAGGFVPPPEPERVALGAVGG
jgi:amidase